MNIISFGQWIVNPAFLDEIKALSGSERIKEWFFSYIFWKRTTWFLFIFFLGPQ